MDTRLKFINIAANQQPDTPRRYDSGRYDPGMYEYTFKAEIMSVHRLTAMENL